MTLDAEGYLGEPMEEASMTRLVTYAREVAKWPGYTEENVLEVYAHLRHRVEELLGEDEADRVMSLLDPENPDEGVSEALEHIDSKADSEGLDEHTLPDTGGYPAGV